MDIKYIAGFFDGEGSLGIYKNGGKNSKKEGYHLRVQMTQKEIPTSKRVLNQLHKRFGGNLGSHPNYTTKKGNYLMWQLNRDSAIFLKKIRRFCIIKRKQIDLALEWMKIRPDIRRDARGRVMALTTKENRTAKQYADKLKLLKKTGD